MKTIIVFISLLSITLASCQDNTDSRWEATDYRNENWHPENGQYFFSEQWTYTFVNESLPADDPQRKGEMAFFVDPPSGTILLTRDASNYGDEMTEWIIVFPEGRYVTGWGDEFGKNHIDIKEISEFPNYQEMVDNYNGDFERYTKKGHGNLEFGVNAYDWPTAHGQQYEKTYEKSNLITELYLTEVPFSLRALYLVNNTNSDLRFLFDANLGYFLPENKLILSEKTDIYGNYVSYQLKSMSPTTHFLDTRGYTTDH